MTTRLGYVFDTLGVRTANSSNVGQIMTNRRWGEKFLVLVVPILCRGGRGRARVDLTEADGAHRLSLSRQRPRAWKVIVRGTQRMVINFNTIAQLIQIKNGKYPRPMSTALEILCTLPSTWSFDAPLTLGRDSGSVCRLFLSKTVDCKKLYDTITYCLLVSL